MAGATWVVASATLFARTWTYEATAGGAADAPATWPSDSGVAAPRDLSVLVLLMHPKCPCSRATVEELAKLMSDCRGKVVATVLMIRPAGVTAEWERSGLWDAAAAIPGVTVLADEAGAESRRFGAATSGQALLYSAAGELLFAGGITRFRGHGGDNAGTSLLTAILLEHTTPLTPERPATPVYGCPLFHRSSDCQPDGSKACHR